MKSKILIIGGSGLIGSYLAQQFKLKGSIIGIIARNIKNRVFDEHIEADTTKIGLWIEAIKKYEIIINLAGANIGRRWNVKYKEEILNSRILTTKNIVASMSKNQILFNASAVGYYGNCGEKILTEDEPPKDDFLSKVCKMWEDEALVAKNKGARVYIMRFGVVASRDGGAFIKLIKNHKLFLGSVLGDGTQYFSSIHIEDIYSAISFLINKAPNASVFNFTIPNPVTNRELTHTISRILKRPIIIPFIPSNLLKLILGEFADTLLFSQRAIPKRLTEAGFEFKFKFLEDIVKDLVQH
ncbi:MAG: TIGR01777 family oxidoreductase [Deltaproteobacteria bacterium]|nr:TIGR01777 family oxidoreductase [Deltaproteobacteria bacterium]